MAHEALVSLNLMIDSSLNMLYFNIFQLLQEIELVREEVWSLKSVLELDHFEESERLNALKGEILEAIPTFRDLFKDRIKKYQNLDAGSSEAWIFDEKVRKEMISFVETMKKMKKEYNAKDLETSNVSPLADPIEYFGGVHDEDLRQLINKLEVGLYSSLKIIWVVGMVGIGKTTIVTALHNEQGISDYFDYRAFVRVGPDYRLKDIMLDLLVCLFPNYDKILGIEKNEIQLKEQIYKFMIGRRFLIVFDDVWDNDLFEIVLELLPDKKNGSRIIFTTRLLGLAFYNSIFGSVHEIGLRNEEESWNLFCRKVSVPPGFKKVGKKIVKKCEGLPLGIISLANILSKDEKTLDYWEKVAKNENLLAFATEEGSPIADSLFLSYKYLPPHLKECCLYFGVFPLNHEISISKLIKLWVAEGLVQPKHFQTFEETAQEYLEKLVLHNIVLFLQQSYVGVTKTCRAHYFFWHLLVKEAASKKIFHLINSYSSVFSKDIHCQRRLCIHRNALLGFKHVSESIESVSNVRSFLCTGPKHQYPVPICSGSTALKVLDALTVRFYKFPVEILELVELKYLAFTYDGNLPYSISILKNLVYLIVHRYNLTIINSSPSYMPVEIWNMQELRHLQVMGSDLPHPVDGAQLPNLLALLGVSDRSCTKEILQSIPNLQKLGVQIVLPQGVSQTLDIFDHLALLDKLESFKFMVSNPNPRSQQVLLLPKSVFRYSLRKLTLSGCGFAWEDMSMIGRALTNLRVLKLRCYAFQGKKWVVDGEEFPNLEYLLLEDIDLVHWNVVYVFPQLKHLIIRHCYKLEEIPHQLGEFLKVIELVDCNPLTLASAEHILEEHRENGDEKFQLQVYFSLDDEKH